MENKTSSLSTDWDDGNNDSADGCSSVCSIEQGWTWSGGTATTKDVWVEIWGDGKKYTIQSSFCDDGNTINNDGWSSTWNLEAGWSCSGGSPNTKDVWTEIWGDSKKFNSVVTYWDDGNLSNGDGWDAFCKIESGYTWSGGSSTSKDVCKEICGDGKKYNQLSTYWDDGNLIGGDGWSSTCSVETGFLWSNGSTIAKDIWILTIKTPTASAVATASSTQAAAGVGMGVSAGSSLLSMSSPAAIFIMINQFQLLLLLPLTGAYISDQVLFTITGMSMALFSFDFLKLEKIPTFNYLFDFLSIIQVNKNLEEIGIKSGNSLINLSKLFLIFVILRCNSILNYYIIIFIKLFILYLITFLYLFLFVLIRLIFCIYLLWLYIVRKMLITFVHIETSMMSRF